MAHNTPWVNRHASSSLPSDRLRPSPPSSRPPSTAPKGKGKGRETPQPKSAEVTTLDKLLNALQNGPLSERDPLGGCFCQARTHALSAYTPLCRHCGLILCTMNPPFRTCPHCSASPLSDAKRAMLIEQLKTELTATIAKEAEAKELQAEQARQAAGAFPTLGGAASPLSATSAPPPRTPNTKNEPHVVLSLNQSTKRVTVRTYATPVPASSPAASRPASRNESRDEIAVTRVPPPSPYVEHAKDAKADPMRPWAALNGETLNYVPPRRVDVNAGSGSKSGRRKKNNSGTEKHVQT